MVEQRKYAWAPQPGPQAEAISVRWLDVLLFGGARGGGKSDYLLGDFLQDVERYNKNWQGVLFRKSYKELEEIISRSQDLYPMTGAIYRVKDTEWKWSNGASLKFRHMENEKNVSDYQGHQYTWIGWDEIGNWSTSACFDALIACLRWGAADVPEKRIRCSGNPGGPGHEWVKSRFIDKNIHGYEIIEDKKSGLEYMFIPSRVQDNKILMERDPNYVKRLNAVGSPQLVRAWLEGDWSAVIGAYFPEFSALTHVVKPFKIPEYWTKFRAFDWGSSSPFACGWFAVSDGSIPGIPSGALVMYKEWYGGELNKGLKMLNEDIAKGIVQRDGIDNISYSVADPAMFAEAGGPSMAEVFKRNGVNFRPADNKRVPGWNQVRSRLVGQDGKAMVYFFHMCHNTIRTLPLLQHDTKIPEDLDTDSDDHCADMLRYACMSRPYAAKKKKRQRIKSHMEMTYYDLTRLERRKR